MYICVKQGYILWSFARAYPPEILAPFANQLAISLLVTSLSDREIQVRRAAAAAFQENAGRHGLFPHGIDVITTADYFTLGNITNSYTQIAIELAHFDEYRQSIMEHFVSRSLQHWDRNIRLLASTALGMLANKYPDMFLKSNILWQMIDSIETDDFEALDGHLLAIGEICVGLQKFGTSWNSYPELKNVA